MVDNGGSTYTRYLLRAYSSSEIVYGAKIESHRNYHIRYFYRCFFYPKIEEHPSIFILLINFFFFQIKKVNLRLFKVKTRGALRF
jgi:hypothetical protein